METHDRSSYPDSPHPGHWHPTEWIVKPYSIMVIAIEISENRGILYDMEVMDACLRLFQEKECRLN